MKRRIFTITDQRKFASFSGDFNPIHLDNQKSIKTHAGQPIVHGVHLVLWALDVFKIKIRSNTVIETSFKSQVNLNEEVVATFNKVKNQIVITSENKLKTYSNIKLNNIESIRSTKPRNDEVNFLQNNFKPEEKKISEVITQERNFEMYGGIKNELGESLFPFLVQNLGLNIVYELACISSIVGMKVPGEHSLFAGLHLEFSSEKNQDHFFVVDSKHELLKVISLGYFGINFNANIKALFRPEPSVVKNIESLKLEYKKRISLKGKKVLIIGGSRGIGAYVTKLSSIMGASVTFTYNTNEQDAEYITEEVLSNGGKIVSHKLNVLDMDFSKIADEAFDYIYYFATPKILSNKSLEMNIDLIQKYRLFYVDVFKKVIDSFILKNSDTKFLYPSTDYIDENRTDFKEYIAVKLEGEDFCKSFNKINKANILFPRLPQLDTDQNLSLRANTNGKASDYAFKLINMMSVN